MVILLINCFHTLQHDNEDTRENRNQQNNIKEFPQRRVRFKNYFMNLILYIRHLHLFCVAVYVAVYIANIFQKLRIYPTVQR